MISNKIEFLVNNFDLAAYRSKITNTSIPGKKMHFDFQSFGNSFPKIKMHFLKLKRISKNLK
jgi:hypothetical protein